MSRLLALDQSSNITGYAIFNNTKLEKVDKFAAKGQSLDERLVYIRNKVLELIKIYQIDEVIFEDIQQQNNIGNNVATFKTLAEVYGVISETLKENNIPYSTVLAVQWKSASKIKGKTRAEQKRNTQEFVLQEYGLKVTQDEADSIGIGRYHILTSGFDWTE